jgi:N-acetylneuraminic acid mutarotase
MNNSGQLQIYDPMTGAWDTTRRAAPTPRNRAAADAIGGKLYVVGGMQGCAPCTALSTLEIYDPATDTWDTTAPGLPTARTGPAATAIDGKLYVIGGADFGVPAAGPQRNLFFATLEVYDPATRSWDTTRAPMPTARREPAAAVLDGRLYVMGGTIAAGGVTAAVEVYDPCTNTWSAASSLPAPRSSAVAGVVGRTIHLLGGRAADYNTTLTAHDVFAP